MGCIDWYGWDEFNWTYENYLGTAMYLLHGNDNSLKSISACPAVILQWNIYLFGYEYLHMNNETFFANQIA